MKSGRSATYILGGVAIAGLLVGGSVFVIQEREFRVEAGEITVSEQKGHQALKQHVTSLQNTTFTLAYKDTTTETSLQDLGVSIDLQQTIQKAKDVQDSRSVWQNPMALFQEERIDIQYDTDTTQLRKTLTTDFQANLKRPQNASYTIKEGSLRITSSQPGRAFDIDAFQANLQKVINGSKDTSTLSVSLTDTPPEVSKENLINLRPKVKTYVLPDHTFVYADRSWKVSPQTLLSWLVVETQQNKPRLIFRKEKIRTYLQEEIADEFNLSPRDANVYFNPQTQKLQITSEGREGRIVHVNRSLKQFLEDLRVGENQTQLVVDRPEPGVYRKNIHELDISAKLGSGTTTFTGSSASRINNIKTGAAEMSGSLVMPGEEFSFVETLGPVTAATGYEPEIVIKNGQNVPEYGGGICQVSTTMFRAVMDTSLEITARRNHSYIIPIYGKPGFDATIYQPRPDFAFKNTTDSPILLQHQVNGTRITFNIYGSPNNKRAEVEGPFTLQKNPDGSTKTVVHRNVYNTETGQRVDRDSFYSYYEPRNNFETVSAYE